MLGSTSNVKVVIDAQDNASKVFRKMGDDVKAAFDKISAAAAVGLAGIVAFSAMSVKKAAEMETAQRRLSQIVKTSTGASDAQVSALIRQAEALEEVGVVSKGAIIHAQGQLAAFDLQTESIEKLIPSMLNYAVAEKGINASAGDLQSVTNGLAQALQGNFAALTKAGFVLDDYTKGLIANGTESERVAALAGILDSTYGGLNETLRDTTEGQLFALKNQFENIAENVGAALIPAIRDLMKSIEPVIKQVADWIKQNPELTAEIVKWTAATLAVIAAISPLIGIIGALGGALMFLAANPVVLVIAALVAFGAALAILYQENEDFRYMVDAAWSAIRQAVEKAVIFLHGLFMKVMPIIGQIWNDLWYGAQYIIDTVFKPAVEDVISFAAGMKEAVATAVEALASAWNSAWNAMATTISSVSATVGRIVDTIVGYVSTAISALQRLAGASSGSLTDRYTFSKSTASGTLGAIATPRAGGGSVSAGSPYVVGEVGAELFVPHTSGTIIPNNKLSGGQSVQVVITGNQFYGEEGIADRIGNQIMQALRQNVRLAFA
jgi:hypothetical protein